MTLLAFTLLVLALPPVLTVCILVLLRARPNATLGEASDAIARGVGWILGHRPVTAVWRARASEAKSGT